MQQQNEHTIFLFFVMVQVTVIINVRNICLWAKEYRLKLPHFITEKQLLLTFLLSHIVEVEISSS